MTPTSVGSTGGDNHITVNVTSFSQFGASSSTSDFQSVLPVKLVYFYGEKTTAGAQLTWQTASEKNNAGFEIQRAENNEQFAVGSLQWENIGFVSGNGTTQTLNDYEFPDLTTKEGINYYRLKQIDYDGAFAYSPVVSIDFSIVRKPVNVFPNPVKNQLNIVNGEGQATIYNILGQPVQEFTIINEQLSIDVSDLAEGQYILRIIQNGGTVVTKQFTK